MKNDEIHDADGVNKKASLDVARDDTQKSGSITELEKKRDEYLNGWKRAQADYQNLVKEFEGRRNDYVRFANANLIIELLPILDNFKAAFNQIPEVEKNSPWVTGFQYIKKQLEDFLTREGVETIKTVGEPFDHVLHEIVDEEVVENAPLDPDVGETGATSAAAETLADKQGDIDGSASVRQVVTKEIRAGYLLNNKVVQVAKVVVREK